MDALFDKIEKLGLDMNDIDESFVRGSGAGGQKINKTSNKVQMLHKGAHFLYRSYFSKGVPAIHDEKPLH